MGVRIDPSKLKTSSIGGGRDGGGGRCSSSGNSAAKVAVVEVGVG